MLGDEGAGVAAYVAMAAFTAIGAGCRLEGCEIEHSIVMDDTIICDVGRRITDSLIGKHVVVERTHLKPKAIRLMLGDHSHVGIEP